MLSIFALKSASNALEYYSEHDYYTEDSNISASSWYGKGASQLSLTGEVAKEQLDKLLHGKVGEQKLGVVRDGKLVHRSGWDLTFSAPKTVSILALVGKDERLIAAHEKAVRTACSYIEKHYLHTRSYVDDKLITKNTNSAIIAQFQHKSSRELDPQLKCARFSGHKIKQRLQESAAQMLQERGIQY